MLLGTWEQPIDPSGRLTLPSALRPLLTDGLVVTRGFDPCLQVFPQDSWKTLAGRVSALPLGGTAERRLRRLLFAAASALSDEGDHIVRLPQQLCAYAAIADHAVIVGMDTYLEIWAPERWNALDAEITGAAGSWPDSDIGLGGSALS
ncbi:MAG: division/cell wall cluster transcriptional repressor MraZ [Chloroflexales bacterium]